MTQVFKSNMTPNFRWGLWFMIFVLLVGLISMLQQEYSSGPNDEPVAGTGANGTEAIAHKKRSLSVQEETAIRAIKDVMVNDLYELAATAYQYRLRPTSLGGGQGSYAGFTLPNKMKSNANATFEAYVLSSNEVRLTGVSKEYGSNAIVVRVDEKGEIASWSYSGDFRDL